MLYLAENFDKVDDFIRKNDVKEVLEKHFPYKRAFIMNGVMIEIFLVERSAKGFATHFLNGLIYTWPDDIFSDNLISGMKIAGENALRNYRKDHDKITKK